MMVVAVLALGVAAQVPTFSMTDYEGWTYNRNDIPLNNDNISQGKIRLFMENGKPRTLTSPLFDVDAAADSLIVNVTWRTENYNQQSFVLSKSALTVALFDVEGHSLDSVTVAPTVVQREHKLRFAFGLPLSFDAARVQMRLACWKGDIVSNGAVRKVEGSFASLLAAYDVSGDGLVNVGDVNVLLADILAGVATHDLNGDGAVNVGDVNLVLNYILRHS